MNSRDTIFALSSGGLPSGVAIIRVSGGQADDVIRQLSGRLGEPRRATLRPIRTRSGDPIDQALVLRFPGPDSFTGEDCVEFHLHGGRAVVTAMLKELASIPGLRHAEAGEFSRRAFDNGKLDLVEIEGLADLIAADTEMQHRLALEQSSGTFSRLYADWAARLTRCWALIEAELDFSEEDDVNGAVSETVWPLLERLTGEIRAHLNDGRASEIIRDGFKVAIVGPPNAGKSSLLNALAKRDVAIVTDQAGTTRDVLGIDLQLGGYLVHVMDTAGIRVTDDVVEREGVLRALRSIEQADLVLLLSSPDTPDHVPDVPPGKPFLAVQSKVDLLGAAEAAEEAGFQISSKTGFGLDSLMKRILEEVEKHADRGKLGPARRRQQDLLAATADDIGRSLEPQHPLEVKAEFLRRATHSLGRLTGRVDVEDLLDVIFSEFCIGK